MADTKHKKDRELVNVKILIKYLKQNSWFILVKASFWGLLKTEF